MTTAEFRFGPNSEHQCRIVGSWFGLERYYVDGRLIRTGWSLTRTTATFVAFGHDIRIEVHLSSDRRRVEGKAYVDGACVASDLFAQYNEKLASWSQRMSGTFGRRLSLGAWLLRVVVWAVVAFTVFQLLKHVLPNAA